MFRFTIRDVLWLTAQNPKSFAGKNGSKNVIH